MADRKPFGSFAPAPSDDPWSGPQINYSQGPTFGELSPYDLARLRLHSLAMGAGVPNPSAIDAQRAAQANRPWSDVAGEALSTAGAALPASAGAYALQGAGDVAKTLLSPTPAGGGDALSIATPDEIQEMNDLEKKITSLKESRGKAQDAVPKSRYRDPDGGVKYGQDPAIVASKVAPFDQDLAAARSRQAQIQSTWSDRQSQKGSAEAPYAQQHPGWQSAFDYAPGISLGTGVLSGLGALKAVRAGLTPAKAAAMGLGLGGGFGLLEGELSQTIPMNKDLSQPQDSAAYKAAAAQLPSWMPESVKYSFGPYLSDRAIRSAVQSGMTGTLGSMGVLAKGLLPAAGRNAAAAETSIAPTVSQALPTEAAAPAKAPMSWAPVQDANGRHRWPKGHPYAGQWAPTPPEQ